MEHHAHHFGASFYAGILLLTLCDTLLMIYIITQLTKARGSFLVRGDGNLMLFRKPLPLRRAAVAGFGLLSLIFISNMVLVAGVVKDLLPAYVMCILALWLPVLSLHESGPDDIRLDGSQRVYERRFGWPWKPSTRSGSFDDIEGVRISRQNTVYIHLKQVKAGIAVSSSGTKAAAEALVNELKREYGFPVLTYPKE